jgi:hypothetical protein
MTGAGTQQPLGISCPKGKMVEESASSVPVPLLSLTSKICAEHYWPGDFMGDWPRLSALSPPTARGKDDVHTVQPVQER